MNRPAITQITNEADVQTLQSAHLLPDRKQVQQSLCGVLTGAVTRINDRFGGELRSQFCCTLARMS